jgi:hypothetical protein
MKHSTIARTLLATSIALAAPLAANAAPTAPVLALASSAPIAVSDINFQTTNQQNPGFLSLAFKNTSNVAASEVVFELDENGHYSRKIDDVGTFAPGVTIKHGYFDFSTASDQDVKVIKVQFVDGTTWTNAGETAPRSRRQAS